MCSVEGRQCSRFHPLPQHLILHICPSFWFGRSKRCRENNGFDPTNQWLLRTPLLMRIRRISEFHRCRLGRRIVLFIWIWMRDRVCSILLRWSVTTRVGKLRAAIWKRKDHPDPPSSPPSPSPPSLGLFALAHCSIFLLTVALLLTCTSRTFLAFILHFLPCSKFPVMEKNARPWQKGRGDSRSMKLGAAIPSHVVMCRLLAATLIQPEIQ